MFYTQGLINWKPCSILYVCSFSSLESDSTKSVNTAHSEEAEVLRNCIHRHLHNEKLIHASHDRVSELEPQVQVSQILAVYAL